MDRKPLPNAEAVKPLTHHWSISYGIAALAVGLVFALRYVLNPLLGENAPLLVFTVGVAVAAWFGGFGPGVFATLLSLLLGSFFFVPPPGDLISKDTPNIIREILFLGIGIFISFLSHRRLKEIQTARESNLALEKSRSLLIKQQERLTRMIEAAQVGIAFADVNGKILEANNAFLDLLGWTRQELASAGLNWKHFTPLKYADRDLETIQLMNESGSILPATEMEFNRRDGTRVPVLVSSAMVRNGQDDHVIFAVDISGRKAAEQERERLLENERQAREQAVAANRLKDEFLANVSHELRSPLNAILGWSQMIRESRLNEAQKNQGLQTIERNSRHLSHLVEELLDISRIVSGKLQLEVKPVNLTETINSAVESIRPAATGKSIEVEISNDFPDAAVPGDVDRLQQVFWNLLTNAVKFTPNNGRISLTVKEVGSFCEISVKDTGRGISPDFLPFVFERFRQADRFFSGPRAGLGLGLAITQHLVEAHGGTIQAFSEGEGQGATFVVQFPVLAEQHDLKFPAVTTPALARNHAAQERLKDLRILMVDDDPDACEVVRTILEEHGAIVTTAFSASEAFQILQKEKPDLLISDIIMPEENGYQFIRRVRSFEKESGVRIPAVALTAKARVEDRLEALSAGFQIHVPKPVEPAELEVVVANLAGRDKFIM